MAKPSYSATECPPPARRHSIAVGMQSPGMSSNPSLRRSSITDSLSSLSSFLAKRRESRESSLDLANDGVDKDLMQRVLAKHFGDLTIKVYLD